MKKIFTIFFITEAFIILILCVGCNRSPEIKDNYNNMKKSNKKITLGFSQLGAESEWRNANTESIKSAAQEEGINLEFSNALQIQENQIKAIRCFIAQKVDVIAFSPVVETGWDSVLQEAKDAHIPVIITDRKIYTKDTSLYITLIGSDFYEEGKRAGEWLVNEMKDIHDNINIVEINGTIGSSPTIEREEGFRDVIKNYPNMKIIITKNGDYMRSSGKEVMEGILSTEKRKIDVVFAQNDDMALGAIEAVEEAGIVPGKDIKFISVDAERDGFLAMIDGKLNCSVECNPLLGKQLMSTVKEIVDGKTVPKKIVIPESIFTEETAAKELPKRKY